MARTIYFPDGSCEVLCAGDNERTVLERILRERLGEDVVELFQEIADPNIGLEDELKNYETSCEEYHSLLQDTANELCRILRVLNTNRTYRKETTAAIQRLLETINNQL